MRQARKERGKMGDTRQDMESPKHAAQVDSLRKRADVIFEDYPYRDEERFDSAIEVLAVLTERSGTTVQDALDILEEARTILLKYQLIS